MTFLHRQTTLGFFRLAGILCDWGREGWKEGINEAILGVKNSQHLKHYKQLPDSDQTSSNMRNPSQYHHLF